MVQKGPTSTLGGHFVIQDTQQSILLPPDKAELIIGRSDPADEYFPDVDLTFYGGEEAGVSRRHARLSIEEGKPSIEDLNSTNFTFVNQQTLLPGKHYPLHSGDVIQLGRLSLIFVSDYE
jgi:pSer/pThr/pTyr-binding forkhead associated (FHA) protein